MSNKNMSNNNNFCIREKKSLKKKQRTATRLARLAKTEKPAIVADLPVSLPEKKKMRTKENLFNHVDDDVNAYLDAQEA